MPGPTAHHEPRVLIVTGGLLSVKDRSLYHALRKQVATIRASSGAWLDVYYKVIGAENLLALRREQTKLSHTRIHTPYRDVVERYFADERNYAAPELSEVLLATLLEAEGVGWEASTYSELHADAALRERLLDRCEVVFASTTLLRDLSEVAPLVATLKRPDNRVVAGGALATLLADTWPELANVDLVAAGYGEMLVPALVRWMRSGFQTLEPPPGGRLMHRGRTPVLHSGVPAERSLDDLVAPDWSLVERYHAQRFPMIHYDATRGCPFHCAFCSYPYLFDDRVCRLRSAERIAKDWIHYAQNGAEFITCLDSTFTFPRKRLVDLCDRLIKAGSPVRWICYARADDLTDPKICELMAQAGCLQVQIGVESGNETILENMAKRCSLDASHAAVENCRKAGIASFVTIIIGFPGETPATIRDSYAFIRSAEPDFAYPTPFTTRVEAIPVLDDDHRQRFGLRTAGGNRSSAPYWRHHTMSCEEVGEWQHWFIRRMMLDRAALECSLFYKGMLSYRPEDRNALLDFQYDAATGHPVLRTIFGGVGLWVRSRLEQDVNRVFGASTQ